MSALFQLANTFMSVRTGTMLDKEPVDITTGQWKWVGEIVNAINKLLWPILILVGTAGVIYAIYLGVNLARADSADKQKEAKQRMLNAIIGLVSIIALILLLKLFCEMLPEWAPSLFGDADDFNPADNAPPVEDGDKKDE